MRSRLSKVLLLAGLVGALLVPLMFVGVVEAQKQGSTLWYPVATVQRVKKPNREPTRPVPTNVKQRVALLTLQWHLLRRVGDNRQEEADPRNEFRTLDRLKLAITTNQNGYLYIINQPEGKDGVLLFPDLRINNGQNKVLRDKEYLVPSYCPDLDLKDCWFQMVPPAGTETMIVIFSRDKITTLPNQINKPYAAVKRDLVNQLISDSQQKVKQETGELAIPGRKAVRYATRVQNINKQDNEELIATIELTHGG